MQKKINKYISIFCFFLLSAIFADLNLTIELEGNEYNNIEEWYEEESLIYYNYSGAATSHVFETPFLSNGGAYLDIQINGDFDSYSEYANIYIEENLIGTVGNFYDQYNCNFYESYSIDRDEFNDYIDDGLLEITIDNTSNVGANVCGDDYHQVQIQYEQDVEFDLGEVEIGSNLEINLIVDTFYDDYYDYDDDDEVRMAYIDVIGDSSFSCENSSCGLHLITSEYPHTTNISFSPINQNYSEASIYVYDYDGGEAHQIKLSGSGIISSLIGDLNDDEELNVYDIVILVNHIFSNEYNAVGDLNADGILNISDCILLLNLILDT